MATKAERVSELRRLAECALSGRLCLSSQGPARKDVDTIMDALSARTLKATGRKRFASYCRLFAKLAREAADKLEAGHPKEGG